MSVGYRFLVYQTVSGRKPFEEWFDGLRSGDRASSDAIDARISRIRDAGHFGDTRSVGQGVYELRCHRGPGYRIYYLFHGQAVVLLLTGGDKVTQRSDINKAYDYAADFWRRQ